MSEKITRFDRPTVRLVGDEFEKALREVAARFGLSVKRGRATFSEANVSYKFEAAVISTEGVAETRERQDFRLYAKRFGLEPDDLGKMFTFRGEKFEIIGLKPSSRKYPILGRKGKKMFKFMVYDVKRGLGRPAGPLDLPEDDDGEMAAEARVS